MMWMFGEQIAFKGYFKSFIRWWLNLFRTLVSKSFLDFTKNEQRIMKKRYFLICYSFTTTEGKSGGGSLTITTDGAYINAKDTLGRINEGLVKRVKESSDNVI